MKYSDSSEGHTLPNKMDINLIMLRALMLYRIRGKVDSTNIVAINQSGTAEMVVELAK